MRDDDKRPSLRRKVYAESQRQTHIQERIRQDTRGMRRKARRADKDDESRNRSRKEKSETGIRKGGDHERSPLKICIAVGKEKHMVFLKFMDIQWLIILFLYYLLI